MSKVGQPGFRFRAELLLERLNAAYKEAYGGTWTIRKRVFAGGLDQLLEYIQRTVTITYADCTNLKRREMVEVVTQCKKCGEDHMIVCTHLNGATSEENAHFVTLLHETTPELSAMMYALLDEVARLRQAIVEYTEPQLLVHGWQDDMRKRAGLTHFTAGVPVWDFETKPLDVTKH